MRERREEKKRSLTFPAVCLPFLFCGQEKYKSTKLAGTAPAVLLIISAARLKLTERICAAVL